MFLLIFKRVFMFASRYCFLTLVFYNNFFYLISLNLNITIILFLNKLHSIIHLVLLVSSMYNVCTLYNVAWEVDDTNKSLASFLRLLPLFGYGIIFPHLMQSFWYFVTGMRTFLKVDLHVRDR